MLYTPYRAIPHNVEPPHFVGVFRNRSSVSSANVSGKPARHRALELLANCGHEGCAEAVLLANGITIEAG